MKREILFRGKRIDDNEWVFGSLLIVDEKPDRIVNYGGVKFTVRSDTVGQLVHVKNGTKIFEGDVITYDLIEGFGEPARYNQRGGVTMYSFTIFHSNIKLIGNVFDNPELIESYQSYF